MGLSGVSTTCVVLALLPKIKPYPGNKTVMQALSVVGVIFQLVQILVVLTVPPKPTALLGMMVPFLVFLGVALVVHKEPKDAQLL